MNGIVNILLGRRADGRADGKDRRPWQLGEEVTILACDLRTGKPVRGSLVAHCSVVEADGFYVAVVVGAGREAAYEVFRARTGWDVRPAPSPWRLHHGSWKR
jgi:hypothetical protein